jgi:hypothetical protein
MMLCVTPSEMAVLYDISGEILTLWGTSSAMSLLGTTTPSTALTLCDTNSIESFYTKTPKGARDCEEASLTSLSARKLSLLGMYCTSNPMKCRSSFLTSKRYATMVRSKDLYSFSTWFVTKYEPLFTRSHRILSEIATQRLVRNPSHSAMLFMEGKSI